MLKRTISSDFFTTINLSLFLKSFKALTIGLPSLRFGNNIKIFEKEFLSYLGAENSKIISFYNGRSALYHSLKLIGIKKNEEVIVNGFTCVSVVNAVIQSGAKIIYSDINKTNYGFDLKELEKKINPNTKVIIVQHTFGKNSNIKKIISLAKKYNLLVIEDCAHSLGTKREKIHLGTFGDFSIFSTGRDKVISSVTGGFLVINNSNYFKNISKVKKQLEYPSKILTIKNLMYNIIAYKSYKLYDILGLGKIIIYLSRKFGFITEILNNSEKDCNFNNFNLCLPNSLAKIGTKELEKIKHYNNHRRDISEYYDKFIKNSNIEIGFSKLKTEKNNYFRYPILLKNKEKTEDFYNYMKKNSILLGKTWSFSPIAPIGSNLKKCGYKKSENKNSINISNRLLFLPNHSLVNLKDIIKVVKIINNYK